MNVDCNCSLLAMIVVPCSHNMVHGCVYQVTMSIYLWSRGALCIYDLFFIRVYLISCTLKAVYVACDLL